jgi:hypothetical protein
VRAHRYGASAGDITLLTENLAGPLNGRSSSSAGACLWTDSTENTSRTNAQDRSRLVSEAFEIPLNSVRRRFDHVSRQADRIARRSQSEEKPPSIGAPDDAENWLVRDHRRLDLPSRVLKGLDTAKGHDRWQC